MAIRLIVAISPIEASAVSNTVATVCSDPQTTIASTSDRSTSQPGAVPEPRKDMAFSA
jgi:hypothetical protein